MKSFLSFWVLVMLLSMGLNLSKAQCPQIGSSDYFQLSTQQEINNFPINYPNCTSISGGLIIGTNSENGITDLTPLQQLTSARDLTIQNLSVTNLNGLQNINSIGGLLSIRNCPNLNDISVLSGITTLNKLQISTNNSLTSLNGLHNLTVINGEAEIVQNAMLPNLNGLSGLTEIKDRLFLRLNPKMKNFEGLNNLTRVGSLSIQSNAELENVKGFEGITTFTGSTNNPSFLITFNNKLTDLTAFSSLTSLGNLKLNISNNAALTSLSGLNNINHATISNLFLESSVKLSTCSIKSICDYISAGKPATISGNSVGCNSREEIQQFCVADTECPEGNVALTTQQEVNAFLSQYPNCITIAGSLLIGKENESSDINNISALQKITKIVGGLKIKNTALQNLNGLNSLLQIGGDLVISDNQQLESLNSLTNLNYLSSGTIKIVNNNVLTSLTGLDNINPESISNLILQSSQNLSTCDVPSICKYISTFGNTYNISGNATGCSSVQEVLLSCEDTLPQCPNEKISLRSQAELDHFLIQYPHCTTLVSLEIGDVSGSNISNLSALKNIKSIVGAENQFAFLSISRTQLQNLVGLENLNSVNYGIAISYNNQLQSLNGLQNLVHAPYLSIQRNPILTNIGDLQGLTNTDEISISFNDSLPNLTGLNNLKTSKQISVYDNKSLQSLEGLNNLEKIFGDLRIDFNPKLTTLSALNNVTDIFSNEGQGEFGGRLRVDGNDALTSLAGLENLKNLKWLEIQSNKVLTDLSALSNLTTIGRNLVVGGNPSLTSLQGLHNVKKIGTRFSDGSATGYLTIYNNLALKNLNGLASLEEVVGSVNLSHLNSLDGLQQLKTIGYSLHINENQNLVSLNGLNGLTRVNQNQIFVESIQIAKNPKLVDLTALKNFKNMPNTSIYIDNNLSLKSLDGLDGINANTNLYDLFIRENPLLAKCNVPVICNWLSDTQNRALVFGNSTGCNSTEEIKQLCSLSVEQIDVKPYISMYPVPVKEILNISPIIGAKVIDVEIYSTDGKKVILSKHDLKKIDLTHLQSGIYLVKVVTDLGIHQQKIIKK